MKNWVKDLLFLLYVLIVMPFISLIYFGIALSNFDAVFVIVGAIILWLIFIPYPIHWYLKNRIFI